MRFGFFNACSRGPVGQMPWAARPEDPGRHHSDRHHRGWGRSHGEAHRSRARMFEQGDLRFVILKLLADKPSHGYEIIKDVETRFGGGYAPSPGIVYPTLTMLEDQGFIALVDGAVSSEAAGSRKLYGLTDEGRAELERSRADVDRVFGRMNEYRQRYGGGPAPEIRRAMDNLQTALRLRLDRTDTDDVRGITAILDGAARAIEDL